MEQIYGRWMWTPEWGEMEQDRPVLVYFRRTFLLTKEKFIEKRKCCEIRISAETRYKLYVNGELAEIGPSKGDRFEWFYDTVNIGPFLTEGENVLAVSVLHYPPLHGKGKYSLYRTDTPGLYVEETYDGQPEPLGETAEDVRYEEDHPDERNLIGCGAGTEWHCRVDKGYRNVSESDWFAPLMIMEDREGDAELTGWKTSLYKENHEDWKPVFLYRFGQPDRRRAPGQLVPRTIPYMKKEPAHFAGVRAVRESRLSRTDWNEMLAGNGKIEIGPRSTEIVELTAGEETTGFLRLLLKGGRGTGIRILCSESYYHLNDNSARLSGNGFNQDWIKGDRDDAEHGMLRGYTDHYLVAGSGMKKADGAPEEYEPFWFRTFRYVQLEVKTCEEPLTILAFDYRKTGYPLEILTEVKTSDSSLNEVYDLCKRTLECCMQETYTDCPFYEQLQYVMDSRSQMLYTYACSADDRLARRCMEDFRKSQRADGLLEAAYPSFENNVIPGFSIYFILMVHDHMMYFGEKKFLREYLGCIDQILQYFDRNLDDRGLVAKTGGRNGPDHYWSFIDWTSQWDSTSGVPTATLEGPVTMESLLYILGLEKAAEICEYVGRRDTAAEYRDRSEAVRTAVRTYCRNEKGFLTDGPIAGYPGERTRSAMISQHTQVFAILTGTVTPEEGRAYLTDTLDHPDDYAQCSVAMMFYLFRAMEKTGLYGRTDEKWDIWRDMLKNHLTTCVEDSVRGRSDCHAWGALALYEFPASILGVRPTKPGFADMEIRPVKGVGEFLDHAEGNVITPKGLLHTEW